MKLTVKDLEVHTADHVLLPRVSFELASGESAVVTGPSGSGKTTLLRVLSGLHREFEGSAEYLAEEERLTPEMLLQQGGVSFLFQENRLLPELSAVENVRITLHGEAGKNIDKIIKELTRVLPGVDLTRPVDSLSGGEKRRVALVRALYPGENIKKVFLLDEPFTGLDAAMEAAVGEYILEKSRTRTIIVTDHEGEHFPDWTRITVGEKL